MHGWKVLLFSLFFATLAVIAAQLPRAEDSQPEMKLPSGKSQREEILKVEFEKTLKDSAELVKVAEELKIELEKNERHVLAVSSLKKLETIEKLTKRIRGRMTRY